MKSERVFSRYCTLRTVYGVCACLCVCCHPIHSGRHTCGRTSRGHTGFLHLPPAVLASIFIARRIQPSLSLVDREVEFCVPTK